MRGQFPTLDERLKISTTKQLQDGATIKTFNDDDYELESLTLEEESRLGKLELDNKMNENKRKRSLNALLSEQRVQGAYKCSTCTSTNWHSTFF